MADKAAIGTAEIVTNLEAGLTGFLWCTIESIEKYLDRESSIAIGDGASDTYALVDAIMMENAVVDEIVGYLSTAYEISRLVSDDYLRDIAAKLTAGQIGAARMGASMGNELTSWTFRLKNEGWAALQRIFIHQTLQELTTKSIPYWRRLMLAKTRERAVIATEP